MLLGYLTQSAMAAVAREVIDAYGDATGWAMANPVGTGPYRLGQWRRGQKIVLEANPNFREEYFPEAGEPGDRELDREDEGQAAAAGRGASTSRSSRSRTRSFSRSTAASSTTSTCRPTSSATCSIRPTRCKPDYAQQGVTLHRVTQPALAYTYFNMEDPVVGGYTPEKIALRRAIDHGLQHRGDDQGLVAGSGAGRHAADPARRRGPQSGPRRAPAVRSGRGAGRSSTSSATSTATATAGASRPTEAASPSMMASTPTGRDRERDELWKKNMTAIGIRIDFLKQKWPDLLRMGRAGQLQMWPVGWINTYGEGDAFMQLLYSRNIGQSNYSRFTLPEYDELYRKSKRVPDGPERNALYREDGRARRRVQPVGPRRLPDREHAGPAVGAGVQEARESRAPVEVPRRRTERPEGGASTPPRVARPRQALVRQHRIASRAIAVRRFRRRRIRVINH